LDLGGDDKIYALFRVFNLGQQNMGLKIYIDPEEQRRLGILRFAADQYVVTPGPYYYG
jgi:hypothetical protein